MEIIIAATKTCQHRPLLEKILQDEWLPYKVLYFENHPELIKKYKLKHSPLLIVDEKVESIGMPEMNQITDLISKNKDISENRVPKRTENHMIPNYIKKEPDLVEVDTTWGSIQPMQAAKAVLTVGELEVFHHKKGTCPLLIPENPILLKK